MDQKGEQGKKKGWILILFTGGGAIEINLWDLENPEDTLKSSSVKK